jgi:hypothetical protein
MQHGCKKNAEFVADFESVEKVAKHPMIPCEKNYQRKGDRKMLSAYNFFGGDFLHIFSTESKSAANFSFYDTHIKFLNK